LGSDNNISPREIELTIFDHLASGCATYIELKDFLADEFSARAKTDNPDEKLKSRLNDESLFKLLSQLRKNELIQSARYFDRKKRKNFTLYANTEDSIEVLVRESRYRRDHIRSAYLPGRYAFWHDMDLTKAVRAIKRDGPIYSYHYGFDDEFALRRAAEKAKKGDLYPDLKLNIKVQSGDQYVFRLEVQRSRDRIVDFTKKLSDTRNTLVLYRDRELIRDVTDTHIYVGDNTLFGRIDDFIENGLFKTKWVWSDGQPTGGLKYSKG
jgi:hypothetical protein